MRPSRKFPVTAALFVVVLATYGCGSSQNAQLLDACDLLTAPTARTIIGGDARRTMKAQPNPHTTHCQYRSDTGSLDLLVSDDWEMTNAMTDKNSKTVAGLGDEAYIDAMGLRVRKGTHGMEINATGPAGDYDGAAADAQNALAAKYEIKTAKVLVDRL